MDYEKMTSALKDIRDIAEKILSKNYTPKGTNPKTGKPSYERWQRIEAMQAAANIYNEQKYGEMKAINYIKKKKEAASLAKQARKRLKEDFLGKKNESDRWTEVQRQNREEWKNYRKDLRQLKLHYETVLGSLIKRRPGSYKLLRVKYPEQKEEVIKELVQAVPPPPQY
jgi:hypothetical protein